MRSVDKLGSVDAAVIDREVFSFVSDDTLDSGYVVTYHTWVGSEGDIKFIVAVRATHDEYTPHGIQHLFRDGECKQAGDAQLDISIPFHNSNPLNAAPIADRSYYEVCKADVTLSGGVLCHIMQNYGSLPCVSLVLPPGMNTNLSARANRTIRQDNLIIQQR